MNEREKSNRKIEEWKDPTIGGEEDIKRNAPEKIQKTKKEIRRESCGKRNEFIVRFLLIAMTDILRSNPTGICFNGFILIVMLQGYFDQFTLHLPLWVHDSCLPLIQIILMLMDLPWRICHAHLVYTCALYHTRWSNVLTAPVCLMMFICYSILPMFASMAGLIPFCLQIRYWFLTFWYPCLLHEIQI